MKNSVLRSFPRIVALLLLGAFPAAVAAGAGEAPWLTDYHQALEQARAENRNVLLDFTGSDWCPVCIEMDKEIFDTPRFKDYAAKNLVLLRLDFPVSHPLPQKLQDQNNTLQEKYGTGDLFPVFILVDKNGKVLVRHLGQVEGGPSGFIAMLQGRKG